MDLTPTNETASTVGTVLQDGLILAGQVVPIVFPQAAGALAVINIATALEPRAVEVVKALVSALSASGALTKADILARFSDPIMTEGA